MSLSKSNLLQTLSSLSAAGQNFGGRERYALGGSPQRRCIVRLSEEISIEVLSKRVLQVLLTYSDCAYTRVILRHVIVFGRLLTSNSLSHDILPSGTPWNAQDGLCDSDTTVDDLKLTCQSRCGDASGYTVQCQFYILIVVEKLLIHVRLRYLLFDIYHGIEHYVVWHWWVVC